MTIQFDTISAAFGPEDDDSNAQRDFEVGQVLDRIKDALAAGSVDGPCKDSNGNTIGNWAL